MTRRALQKRHYRENVVPAKEVRVQDSSERWEMPTQEFGILLKEKISGSVEKRGTEISGHFGVPGWGDTTKPHIHSINYSKKKKKTIFNPGGGLLRWGVGRKTVSHKRGK